MTKRQEVFCAAGLLVWIGFCVSQHLKGREAIERKFYVDSVEEDFFLSHAELKQMKEDGAAYYQEVLTWAEQSTAGHQKRGSFSSSGTKTASQRKKTMPGLQR